MPLEETSFCRQIGIEALRRQARHDFAENGDVILGLARAIGPCDADYGHVIPDRSEWALLQEAGQVVGRVGKKFGAPDADEEIEIFAR